MLTNSEFLLAVYGPLGDAHGWVCAFRADPGSADPSAWSGQLWLATANQQLMIDKRGADNCYFSVARLAMHSGPRRVKSNFDALAVLVADDANPAELNGKASYVLETSPGKHQIGVLLDQDDPDTRDPVLLDAVLHALVAAKLIHADQSGNNLVRYVRLPVGTNTKAGAAHPTRLLAWHPDHRLTLEDALNVFGVDLAAVRSQAQAAPGEAPAPAGTPHADLIQKILSGSSLHDPLTQLAAKFVSANAGAGMVVNHLRALLELNPDRSKRWQDRYADIPRLVSSAEQFRPQAQGSVTIDLRSPEKAPEAAAELSPLDWSSLAEAAIEPATFHWRGWLPARTTTLLSANGGVGKSNLSLQLAAALALGGTFLGEPLEALRVLVVSAEDEQRTVHFRLSNIVQDLGAGLADLQDRLYVYDLTQSDSVLWRDGQATPRMQWLADTVDRHQADVVIVDNASDVFSANENDRSEVRGFMRALNSIAMHSGAAVLLLAHVDKASVRGGVSADTNTTFSGSTAWNNSARSRWAMTRDEDAVTLRHEKCNHGPMQAEIKLEFDASAKVFRRFGQVPSAAFARNVMRQSKRVEILRVIHAAEQRGVPLSPHETARGAGDSFKAQKTIGNRREFFAELTAMRLDGLVLVREYLDRHRKSREQLVLSAAGERLLGEG